jgi:hypothetical protein
MRSPTDPGSPKSPFPAKQPAWDWDWRRLPLAGAQPMTNDFCVLLCLFWLSLIYTLDFLLLLIPLFAWCVVTCSWNVSFLIRHAFSSRTEKLKAFFGLLCPTFNWPDLGCEALPQHPGCGQTNLTSGIDPIEN